VLCFSKCCSYLFVTCHLWLVIVTESEPDVPVSRHVDGNDRALVEEGVRESEQFEQQVEYISYKLSLFPTTFPRCFQISKSHCVPVVQNYFLERRSSSHTLCFQLVGVRKTASL
jgi:hypothetical protein